ncbi:major facilitator superfamily domain-containing protein [Flammula alnicola]|nr:major facilitator superfamily domain-containing protein [Flammula alnicola]
MTNNEKKRSNKEEATGVSDNHTPSNPPTASDSDHIRFSRREKWFIVCFTSFVGVFSPLTANIYLPALPTLSQAFHKSTELINLTVTIYMVLQGVAPMLWGPVSDHIGRRPTSAACLLILSLSCVGLALVPTSDFWLLMLLRCLQATGSASTIAIGAGVIGDISSRAERGGFFGIFTLGPTLGPAIGPVIGGALANSLGWRSIFWFLCISASICFMIIILPVIPIIGGSAPTRAPVASKVKIPRNPFRLFLNPDVDVLLIISAIACTVYYATYPFLSETTVGLCFLAIGGGNILGSSITGRVLDIEYRRFKKRVQSRLTGSTAQVDLNQEESFPLEQARLRLTPYYILIMAASCAGYGWCLQKKVNIAGPLILHFIIGYMSTSIMNVSSTLMIDLVPGQSSSVTACNNLIRCTLGAVLVSVIELILKGIGIGWTYVLLAGMLLLCTPLVYLAIRIGPQCRIKRQRRRDEELARIVETSDNA